MNRGFSTYKKINTMGMSQLDLILTVYRGAIGYLNQAQSDFENDKMVEGRIACDKARKCIVHLYTTLDMKKGEAIAAQLGQLYAFMIQQIDLALASKSSKVLNDIIGILSTIKEAWEDLKEKEASQNSSTPAEQGREQDGIGAGDKEASETSQNRERLTFSA